MATPWLKEEKSGKYYMDYTFPDGEIIRRYEDELYQESQSTYHSNQQQDLEGSSGLNPETRTSGTRRHTRETGRSEPRRPPLASTKGTRRDSISFQSTAQPRITSRRDFRQEGKEYHTSRGYNESYGQRVVERATYDDATLDPSLASSSYYDPYPTSQEAVFGGAFYGESSATSDTDIPTVMNQVPIGPPGFSSNPDHRYLPYQEPRMSSGGPFFSRDTPESPPPPRYIRGTQGTVIRHFNPSFRVRLDRETFFRCGRVFKTPWTDSGDHNQSDYNQSDSGISMGAHDYRVDFKVRSFVVFRNNGRSCHCIPISTYNGRGYKKGGIDLKAHGLIYSDVKPENPPGIEKSPLRLLPPEKGERLSRTSYINYGRVYTVGTDVEVKDFGELNKESQRLLHRYYHETIFFESEDESHLKQWISEERQQHQTACLNGIDGRASSGDESHPTTSGTIPNISGGFLTQGDTSPWHPIFAAQQYSPPPSLLSRPTQDSQQSTVSNQEPGERVQSSFDPYEPYRHDVDGLDSNNIPGIRKTDAAWTKIAASTTIPDIEVAIAPVTVKRSTLFRSSSISSLNSLYSPVFSALGSTSSSSSMNTEYLQRFIDLLLNDLELNSLFETAICKISFDKFECNFRRCLHIFSSHLEIEAFHSLPKHAHSLVRRLSTNVAHCIRRYFEESCQPRVRTQDSPQNEPEYGVAEDINGSGDNEMDAVDSDIEEDEGNYQSLEAAMLATNSFIMLRENFKIFLSSDQARRAIFDSWPVQVTFPETVDLKYLAFPGLRQFFMSRHPQQHRLRNVLALVGTDEAAEALSCEDYLLREWPEVGECLVTCVDAFLRNHFQADAQARGKDGNISMELHSANPVDSEAGNCMTVNASYQVHGYVAAASSWLSAVLRQSQFQEVCRSHVSIKATNAATKVDQRHLKHGDKVIEIKLGALIQIRSPKTCWTCIFPNNVIASGFSIQERVNGVGLEISFANLAYASKCLSFVEHDNGLIAHGLKSILIPVAELKDDNAIQWHFESKTQGTSRRPASIGQILRMLVNENWHKVSDPAQLMKRRCFLGWVEDAHIVMGTSAYTMNPKPSGAPICDSKSTLRRFEITPGISVLNWVTLQGTIVSEPVSIPNSVSTQQEIDLLDTLNGAAGEHGIVFDTDKETAWYLPRACIVLQMAHSAVINWKYELWERDKQISRDDNRFYAKQISDGGSSAIEALKQCFILKVRKNSSASEVSKEEQFSDMIARNWHLLSDIAESLDSTANQLHFAGRSASHRLLGVDVLDAITNKRPMKVRRIEMKQHWTLLTAEQPLVLFCRGIPPPIVAVSNSTSPCQSCVRVPIQRNLLVATSPTIKVFLEQQNYGLAEGLDWCNVNLPDLIETHAGKGNKPVRYIQTLQSKRKPMSNAAIQTAIQRYMHGAFIFGNGTEEKCKGSFAYAPARPAWESKDSNLPLRSTSSSEMFTTASATSSEVTNTSESTNLLAQYRHDTDSEESIDLEDTHTSTHGTRPLSQNSLGDAPEQSSSSFGGPHLIAEMNDISLAPGKTTKDAKTTRFLSMFARVSRRTRRNGDLVRRRRD